MFNFSFENLDLGSGAQKVSSAYSSAEALSALGEIMSTRMVMSVEDTAPPENTSFPMAVPLPRVPDGPLITAKGEKIIISMCGPIGARNLYVLKTYAAIVAALDAASAGREIMIVIDSCGGDVQQMAMIISAIRRTKATVTTIALGAVMSAAVPLWMAGHRCHILPTAIFMFHNSSHGDIGISSTVENSAKAVRSYVDEKLMRPMVDKGLLKEEEYALVVEKRMDVFVSASEMINRLGAKLPNLNGAQDGTL